MHRRVFLSATALSFLNASAYAQAADYPSRPINFVFPYPPGTLGDNETREFGTFLHKATGQPWISDYRPGASGTLGSQLAQRAHPDGYTLLYGTTTSMVTGPTTVMKTPYSGRTDFEPVSGMGRIDAVLIVPANSKFKTVDALVAALKADPGKLNYGTVGPGSVAHLSGEVFLRAVGATATPVAYKGPPQAQLAILNGEIDFIFDNVQGSGTMIDAGRLLPLAVASSKRIAQLPQVPTLTEGGVPVVIQLWFGIFAPKGTPKAIVETLSRHVNEYLKDPDVRAKFVSRGFEVLPGTPQDFSKLVAADEALWRPMIKSLNLQPQ